MAYNFLGRDRDQPFLLPPTCATGSPTATWRARSPSAGCGPYVRSAWIGCWSGADATSSGSSTSTRGTTMTSDHIGALRFVRRAV